MTTTPGRTRALLVFPKFHSYTFWSMEQTCDVVGVKVPAPPLGLLTLAAMLPTTWELRLVNRNFQELTDADIAWADLVLTGGMLPQEPDTLHVIDLAKAAGVPVAVGGPAPTSTPEIYEAADFIVAGEAEGILDKFVAAWEAGERTGRFTAVKFKADVTTSPIPRFDLIDFYDYLFIGVQFSRGCPFTCEFCDIIELYGRAPRTKTTPQMLAELDRLYELGFRGHVDFVDDNLIGNKKAVKAFLPELIKWQRARGYPFRFSTEASLNLSDDPDLLLLMRLAGFFLVFCGIESPDEETLVHTSKKQNTRRSISESVHRIYAAGMTVTAGFIVGFDTERASIAKALSTCISDTAIPISVVGMLYALPNTQLERRLVKEGRMFERFSHIGAEQEIADACTAGLNFRTLRPRREILEDFRDTVATVYDARAYFDRTRRMGRMLDRSGIPGQRFHWRMLRRDLRTGLGVAWRYLTKYPELLGLYLRTVAHTLWHNPRAIEAVGVSLAVYLHHYKFSRFVVGQIEGLMRDIDTGTFVEPTPLPAPANSDVCAAPKPKRLAAVA